MMNCFLPNRCISWTVLMSSAYNVYMRNVSPDCDALWWTSQASPPALQLARSNSSRIIPTAATSTVVTTQSSTAQTARYLEAEQDAGSSSHSALCTLAGSFTEQRMAT